MKEIDEGGFCVGKSPNFQRGIYPKLSRTIDTLGQNGVYVRGGMSEIKLEQVDTMRGGVWDKTYKSARQVYGENGLCPTITTCGGGGTEPKVKTKDIIRKLTPRECWRLMGFYDTDFDKAKAVNSNSQLYKQAGNSIVVNVLEAIFKEMF